MRVYQTPNISSVKLEVTSSSMQYQPVDCSGTPFSCGGFFGQGEALCFSGSTLETIFFLPGQDPGNTPSCEILLDGSSAQGCFPIQLIDSCPEGSAWSIECDDSGCGAASVVTVSCDGFEDDVCAYGFITPQ